MRPQCVVRRRPGHPSAQHRLTIRQDLQKPTSDQHGFSRQSGGRRTRRPAPLTGQVPEPGPGAAAGRPGHGGRPARPRCGPGRAPARISGALRLVNQPGRDRPETVARPRHAPRFAPRTGRSPAGGDATASPVPRAPVRAAGGPWEPRPDTGASGRDRRPLCLLPRHRAVRVPGGEGPQPCDSRPSPGRPASGRRTASWLVREPEPGVRWPGEIHTPVRSFCTARPGVCTPCPQRYPRAGRPAGAGQGPSGSEMSATVAARAGRMSSAATATASPCSPAPSVIARPRIRSSAITGHAVTDPNGVMVPRS